MELENEMLIKSCLFCKGECRVVKKSVNTDTIIKQGYSVDCMVCGYCGPIKNEIIDAVKIHNDYKTRIKNG